MARNAKHSTKREDCSERDQDELRLDDVLLEPGGQVSAQACTAAGAGLSSSVVLNSTFRPLQAPT